MKERKKLKKIYSQDKNTIQIAKIAIISAIFIITFFISGYLVSWNFANKLLNDRQFELCEQVARNVYAQKGNVIVEGNIIVKASEDFSVSMTTTTITVQLDDILYRGKVISKLQNGELVMTRDIEDEKAVLSSIFIGILFVLVATCIILIVLSASEYIKKLKKNSRK